MVYVAHRGGATRARHQVRPGAAGAYAVTSSERCTLVARAYAAPRTVGSLGTSVMPADYLWTCACGQLTVELNGAPIFDFDCHCRESLG
jgi:hypothetical protein